MLMLTVPLATVAPAVAASGATEVGAQSVHINVERYADWSMDQDADGYDDRLDTLMLAGATQNVYLFLHYDHRPTQDDIAALEDAGAEQTYLLRNFDTVKVEISAGSLPQLIDLDGVVAVEQYVPPEPHNEFGVPNIRARAATGIPIIEGYDHAQAVHETLGFRGEGMVVAVIDGGVDNEHTFLDDLDDDPATEDPKLLQYTDSNGLPVYAGADFSGGFAGIGCVDPKDDTLHGTHVAGTAIGTGGASGQHMGVAPQARLVDIDIATVSGEGSALVQGQIEAMDWLISFNAGETCYGDPGEDAVDVATMSYGSNAAPDGMASIAIDELVRSGITFTTSAGNSGSDQGTLTTGSDAAIIVGGSDDRDTVLRSDDGLYSSTSRGPRMSDGDTNPIDELRPDVAAPGAAIFSALAHSQDQVVGFSGTSMAAPHVAGTAALMLQANPGLTPVDLGASGMGEDGAVPVRDLLIKTAQYKNNGNPAPQVEQTGRFGQTWNNAWGYGLVDAFSAVQQAEDLTGGSLDIDAGGPYLGIVGELIQFEASATGGTAPYTFDWDFGDGNTATGETVDHAFDAADTYTVTLTVTDSASPAEQATATVEACIGPSCELPFAITTPTGGAALQGGTVTVEGTHTLSASQSGGNEVAFTDEEGDQTLSFFVDTPVPVPLPHADIVSASASEAGDNLVFTIEVADLLDDASGQAYASYYFNFDAEEIQCTTGATGERSSAFHTAAHFRNGVDGPDDFSASFEWGCSVTGSRATKGDISGSVDTAANAITLVAPKSLFTENSLEAGETLSSLSVNAQGWIGTPNNPVGSTGLTPTYDTATTSDALLLSGGEASVGSIEVAIDDPTFAPANQLSVTSDIEASTWEAPWDITDLTGTHTLYARQLDDAGAEQATDQVEVTLNSGGVPTIDITNPTADQTVTGTIDVAGTAGGSDGPNEAPTATLTSDVSQGDAPLDVTFTLDGQDSDGVVDSWNLAFGDGTAPDTGAGDPDGRTVPHTYSQAGTYVAELCVTDEDEAQACTSLDIIVSQALPAGDLKHLYLAGDTVIGQVDTFSDTLDLGVGSLQLLETAPSETNVQDLWVSSSEVGTNARTSPYDTFWTYENPLDLDGKVVDVRFWGSTPNGGTTGSWDIALYKDGEADPFATDTISMDSTPAVPTLFTSTLGPFDGIEATASFTVSIDAHFGSDPEDTEAVFAIHYDAVNYASQAVVSQPGSQDTEVDYFPWAYTTADTMVAGSLGLDTRSFVAGTDVEPAARTIDVEDPSAFSADFQVYDHTGALFHEQTDVALAADDSASRADGDAFTVPADAQGTWTVHYTVTNDDDRSTTRIKAYPVVAATPPVDSATGQLVDTTPPVFDGLSTTAPDNDKVRLSWDPAQEAEGQVTYEIFATLDEAQVFTPDSKVAETSNTAFTATHLEEGRTYHFGVRATDEAGNTDPNEIVRSVTIATATGHPDERVEVRFNGGSWQEASGVDTWSLPFDTTTVSDGPLSIEARYFDGNSFSAIDEVGVTVANDAPGDAFVTFTDPAAGETVVPPVDLAGEFSTDGTAPSGTSTSTSDLLPTGIQIWSQDPWVQDVFQNTAYSQLASDLSALEGFAGVRPIPVDGGVIEVSLTGSVPEDAPATGGDGWTLVYNEDLQVDTLETEIPDDQVETISLEEYIDRQESPDGPNTPGFTAGIGPGTPIRGTLTNPDDSTSNPGCTAAHVYQDSATGKYYLSTAGHCLLSETVTDKDESPEHAVHAMSICVEGCASNTLGIGTYVRFTEADVDELVPYARAGGIGDDFGIIELPEELYSEIRPWMNFWGGPTSLERPVAGDDLVHFGYSNGLGDTFATQARAGVVLFSNQEGGIGWAGAVAPGDSGSGVNTASPRTGTNAWGDGAAAVATHISGTYSVPGTMWGTDVQVGQDRVLDRTGLDLDLVLEKDEIDLPDDQPTPLEATIQTPADGQTIDLDTTDQVTISGTATFPPSPVAPGTGETTYYLHRDDCGGDADHLHMNKLQSTAVEGGDGCTNGADPVQPALEPVLGEVARIHPAEPRPTQDIPLDPTRDIEGTLYLSGLSGTVPSVVNDIELRVTMDNGATLVGSQRITNQIVLGETTAIDFAFPALVDRIPAGSSLEATGVVHHAVGHLTWKYGGDAQPHIDLPLGSAVPNSVEVAIDDGSFQNTLPVTGPASDGSWSATWDVTSLGEGPATIHARATQGTTVQDTPDTTDVTLQQQGGAGPTAALGVSVTDLSATFTDQSTPGDAAITSWDWSFGDGASSTAQDPTHTYTAGGTYSVTLTVTDANGNSDTAQQDVTVQEASDWLVQLRILDDAGDASLDWRTVAQAQPGDAGTWGYTWNPATDPAPGLYTGEVRIVENGATQDTATRTFEVDPANVAPTADAGPNRTIAETRAVTLTGVATDEDGDQLTLTWEQVSGPTVTITENRVDDATLEATLTVPELASDQEIVLRFTADDGTAQATDEVTLHAVDTDRIDAETINGVSLDQALENSLSGTLDVEGTSSLAAEDAANMAPTARISDLVVSGREVTASASTSQDPDGNLIDHQWELGNGDTLAGEELSYTYPKDGNYTITLTVLDDAGAAGQAMAGPVQIAQAQPADLAVTAGDSSYVQVGDPATLGAQAFQAEGTVSFAWDLNGDGTFETPGQTLQVETTGMSPGLTPFTVRATDQATGATAEDQVVVQLYEPATTTQVFTEDVLVGVNDEDAGASGAADGATFTYDVDVPATADELQATLTWESYTAVTVPQTPITTGPLEAGVNDFDLYAFSPGGGQDDNSADLDRPEQVTVEAPSPGTWMLEVRSYLAVDDTTELTVDLSTSPLDKVPILTQESPGCFDTGTQLLEVSAVSQALPDGTGITGAWDLDRDGVYETDGLSATTQFAPGSGAHIVGFQATSPDGLETSMLVAFRVEDTCDGGPSVVVVGVADSGINPYHREFQGDQMPYPELLDATSTFQDHPSTYIDGFPADAQAIDITTGGFNLAKDTAEGDWSRENIPMNQWMWFPGTKIVGAIDTSDTTALNAAPDSTPIYDDDGHGTGAASVAAGNTFGSCPRCVLVFAEGTSGDSAFHDKPWIDFVSVSIGSVGNVGQPDGGQLGFEDDTKAAAERGQTISYAAGNGNANAFLTPQQTYLSNRLGPDWTINVGAVQKFDDGTSGAILGTGKPVDWSSFGSGTIPGACSNNYAGNCGFSGTSAATPISTGVMAASLLKAREAIGDTTAGQKAPAEAGGQLQAVAVGEALPGSPVLDDGVLQRAELWRVSFDCASSLDDPGFVAFPGPGPASPADVSYVGYGVADQAAHECAILGLLGTSTPGDRPNADLFFEADEAIRDALWGDWDGDGDGQPGGNHNTASDLELPLPSGITEGDVATADAATDTLREIYVNLGQGTNAPAAQETYYLHRSACADASDPIWMDRTPAPEQEEGHGCASAGATYSESWTSTVTTDHAFQADSTVTAVVHAFGLTPRPGVQMNGQLLADGVAVGSGTSDPVDVVSVALVTTPCHEFVIDFQITEPIPEDAILTFEADTDETGGPLATCYEGGQEASRVVIQGTGEGGSGGDQATATITTPDPGVTLEDPTDSPVSLEGTASFPPMSQAEPTRAYLRWDGDGTTCGDRSFTLTDGPDGGNGCSNAAGVAGPILPLVWDFPAAFDPVELAPGGEVSGNLYFDTQGATAGQVFVVLRGDGEILGSQRVTFTQVNALGELEPVEVPISFTLDGLSTTDPISDLVLELQVEQQGPVQWVELEDPASYVDLPMASDDTGQRQVQVSIDDPTFTSNLLTVSGTEAWTSSWDLTDVAEGSHTVYARAVQDGQAGPADSLSVQVVKAEAEERIGDVQIQAVPVGTTPTGDGWTQATYDQATGDWGFQWGTLDLMNGEWSFNARLLADGDETVRDVFTAELANSDRAPFFENLDPVTVDENETSSLLVEATDLDLDELTLTAQGLPEDATFTDNGDGTGTLDWQPSFDAAGDHTVELTVQDTEGHTVTDQLLITVLNVNRAPVLEEIGNRTIEEGTTLAFTANATDPDTGEDPTFEADGLPAGATLDAQTGTFEWRPGFEDAGTYTLTFRAVDPHGATDEETITITVVDVPPVAENLDNGLAYPRIQMAVDDAQAGHTIIVYDGSHEEAVTVPTDGLTLCGSNEAQDGCAPSAGATTVDASGLPDPVLTITGQDVTIQALELVGQASVLEAEEAHRLTLAHNTIEQGTDLLAATQGITIVASDGIHAHNTTISGNLYPGSVALRVATSADAKLAHNTIQKAGTGIYLPDSSQARLLENVVFLPPASQFGGQSLGISLHGGQGHSLTGNLVQGAGTGIVADNTPGLTSELDQLEATATGLLVEGQAGTGAAQAEEGTPSTVIEMHNATLATAPTAVHLAETAQGVLVNATCNDWGVYSGVLIPAKIEDEGENNTVEFQPFTGFQGQGLECLTPPEADFDAEPLPATRLAPVNFTDESQAGSRPIATYEWSFGDGASSLEQDPSHQYENVGTFLTRLRVTDVDGMTSTQVRPIEVENLDPVLDPIDPITVPHGDQITFDVAATDPEEDPITLTVTGDPLTSDDATFTDNGDGTGTFTWSTDAFDGGSYTLQVRAEDDLGGQATQTVGLTVINEAPVFAPTVPETVGANEELLIEFNVLASDPDGDAVDLTAAGTPLADLGAVFTQTGDGAGVFTWTPSLGDAGAYTVDFTATSAGNLSTVKTVTINVGDFNTPPGITITGPDELLPPSDITLDVTATDGDSHQVNFTVQTVPEIPLDTLTQDPDAKTATWQAHIPGGFDEDILVTFTAEDGINTVQATHEIQVLQPPKVDILTPIEVTSGALAGELLLGEEVTLRATAHDPDGTIASGQFFEGTVEDGTALSTTQATLVLFEASFTPTQLGTVDIGFEAIDDTQLPGTGVRTFEVVENTPPTVDAGADQVEDVGEDGTFTFSVSGSATDPDARGIDGSSFVWHLPAALGGGQLTGQSVDITLPVGSWEIVLAVDDVNGATGQDTVTLGVDDTVEASATMLQANQQTEDGVFVYNPTTIVGEKVESLVTVLRDNGAPAENALVIGNLTYYGTSDKAASLAQSNAEATTGPDGQAVVALNQTLSVDGVITDIASLPGYYELEITVEADSRAQGAVQDVERASELLKLWIGPAPLGQTL